MKAQLYDVVFMDIQLPEMDGLVATRYIREQLAHVCQPQIIALTGNDLPGDREKCLAADMNGCISKPMGVADLTLVLESCVPLPIL